MDLTSTILKPKVISTESEILHGSEPDLSARLSTVSVILSPSKFFKVFLVIIAGLLIISLTFIFAQYAFNINSKWFDQSYRLFNMDVERNIPTLFSSIQLLISSLVLFYISTMQTPKRMYWQLLSIVFLMLCIDETVQLHELLNGLKSRVEVLHDSRFLHVWVFPYLALFFFFGLFFFKFILQLPIKTRNLFISSGTIFVFGAIGMEMLQEQINILNKGSVTLLQILLYCVEETCEMLGIALFNYALLDYLCSKKLNITIRFSAQHPLTRK